MNVDAVWTNLRDDKRKSRERTTKNKKKQKQTEGDLRDNPLARARVQRTLKVSTKSINVLVPLQRGILRGALRESLHGKEHMFLQFSSNIQCLLVNPRTIFYEFQAGLHSILSLSSKFALLSTTLSATST